MSDIVTVCDLKGAGGYQDWGRLTRAEIIQKTREWAAFEKERAEKILNAPDGALQCKIVRGPRVQHLIERL
jgi:hypothetical protein